FINDFFFSSRRRHTRFSRDWSSDVCSSDLNSTVSDCSSDSIVIDTTNPIDNGANPQFTDTVDLDGNDLAITWTAFTDVNLSNHRSEERRVGKECRSGWRTKH